MEHVAVAERAQRRPSRLDRLARWAGENSWPLAFAAALLAIVLQRLAALGSVPLGQYNDEAAIGYNAWAVANAGIDEHGHAWPLFFESFGDWKSPIYFYVLAPLTRIFGLTPAVERLPAAVSGIAVCILLALAAWRITRSRPVALLVMLTAAVEPWLVVENRVGFDVNMVVLCVAGAIWAATHAAENRPRWFAALGLWIAAAVYAYQTGRIFGAMLWIAAALAFGLPLRRFRQWWLSAVPVAGAYAVLLAWSTGHPGALTSRFDVVGILNGHPGPFTVVARFVNNYVQYWGAPFLATHGDANLRHNTGYGGELLIVTLPAILLGIAVCLRRWREPLPRFTLLGLLFSPAPAALTMEGTPHAVRAAIMVPFLLLASVYGWQRLLPLLASRRTAAAVLAAAALVEGGVFFNDLYHYWPQRSALYFEAGLGPAIAQAHRLADGHEVVISDHFEAPYIFAYFWVQADPREIAVAGPQAIRVRIGNAAMMAAPGDIMVLGPFDVAPPGATLLARQTVTLDTPVDQVQQPQQQDLVVASVWRR